MHYPSLIQHAGTPVDNVTSQPDTAVDKINEAAILGFKFLRLNELHACDLSAQHLHD